MAAWSSDEVLRRSQDLVYQVAYAFYDTPYILLLKLLVQLGVYAGPHQRLYISDLNRCNEKTLADLVAISPNELRRYMGTLFVHRLIRRSVYSPSPASEG